MLTQAYGLLAVDSSRLYVGSFFAYAAVLHDYAEQTGRCDKVGARQYPCCLLPGLSSGLLGDEAVDNLAGLAFGGIL